MYHEKGSIFEDQSSKILFVFMINAVFVMINVIYVYGNEWKGGNLSYHLKDRPKLRMEIENLGEEIILCGKTGESCLEYK